MNNQLFFLGLFNTDDGINELTFFISPYYISIFGFAVEVEIIIKLKYILFLKKNN